MGNWVADEVLYQAQVDPAKRSSALLDDEARTSMPCQKRDMPTASSTALRSTQCPFLPVDRQIEAIRQQTFEVCDVACKANAESARFPDGWLFHHRWAKKGKGAKMPSGA